VSTNVKIKFDTVELREERRHKIRKGTQNTQRKHAGSYGNANDFAEIVDQAPVKRLRFDVRLPKSSGLVGHARLRDPVHLPGIMFN
jgi:hypothetical protein